ncbi:hypothetical protein F5884DRAFT_799223 [Xylogone sp. PMI_703]|nr:hypothetical protein F5884DRAFT_799223 [Xylogone sp. PMI_703]
MDDGTDKAPHVCAACKQYKRKCNKALPSCSTCSRLRRECNYSLPDFARVKPREEITLLRSRVAELENLIAKPAVNKTSSPPLVLSPIRDISSSTQPTISSDFFFLDQRAFSHLHYNLWPVSVPVPSEIINVLSDECSQPHGMEQLASRYFDIFQGWMPIISKTRMKRLLDCPVDTVQSDTAFLLSCMKLLLERLQHTTLLGDSSLYRTVKEVGLQLELAGLQSLAFLQGRIIIAVYELGHGLHSASYATVAQCARQAISIGLHNRRAPEFLQPWADWEEEIRVWWFIVMLDRYVTVGRELRPLCTEDPKKRTPLPADTEAWDQGAMISPERLYISSPTTAITSPYARLAQAFNLLGRVIRHCDDQDPEQDLAFMLEEMNTLHQATSALLELIANEKSEDSYVALAICISTLMKLHKNFLYNSFHVFADKADPQLTPLIRELTEKSLNTMHDISLQTLSLAQSLEQRVVTSGVDKLSPLVLHCLYRAGFWLSYLASVNREDKFVVGRSIIDRVLNTLSVRWKVAGVYKSLISAHLQSESEQR